MDTGTDPDIARTSPEWTYHTLEQGEGLSIWRTNHEQKVLTASDKGVLDGLKVPFPWHAARETGIVPSKHFQQAAGDYTGHTGSTEQWW